MPDPNASGMLSIMYDLCNKSAHMQDYAAAGGFPRWPKEDGVEVNNLLSS